MAKDHAHLVACLIQAESEGKRKAHGPKTKSGRARGLMQVMPFHVKKKDRHRLFDSKFNITVGVRIFSGFVRKRRGNLVKALKDYNSGPASHYYNISYIREVLTNYRRTK
jgi:soluble lytic murein transglycosylase-like protein